MDNEFWSAAQSYAAAMLALLMDHTHWIVSFLGFVLLVARLIVEVPRALRTLKTWRNQ